MPPIIDLAKVEQVKTLATMGKNDSQISRMTGLSRRTVQRYRAMEDPPELFVELSEMRKEQVKRFGEAVWPLIFGFAASLKEDLESGQMKPRDKIIGIGVLIDKLNMIEQIGKGAQKSAGNVINVRFYDESKCGVIVNPAEVPPGELPLQGDDLRPGGGENIFRLPGGDRDCLSIPEELGSGSRFDIQELGGFRPSDDPGGALGEPGDAGGLGRELRDEQTVDGGDL